MSAEAMVCVVLQKLVDILKEESLAQSKIIVYEMVEIIKALKKMRVLMLPNASQVSDIPLPTDGYLSVLYNVEDIVEKFTLALAYQRKALAFLSNYTFFFSNISSCGSILSKLKKFNSQLEKRNRLKQVISPELAVVLLDQHSSFSLEGDRCFSISSALSVKEDEEKVGGDPKLSTVGTLKSSCAVDLETYASGSPYGRGEILSFSYSNMDEELQIVGIKEERLQYCKHMSSFSYREEELGIFGFKDDIHNMVKQLIDRHQVVLCIVGEVGTGKTTLARAIYRNRDIKRHFEFRAWVSVSRDHTVRDILLTLLKGLSENLKEEAASLLDEQALKLKLSEYLADKTYLIVLDGLRSCSMWEGMEDAFGSTENGGKLILTTSSSETTTCMKASFVTHHLKPLNKEDSWNMFLKKAGREHSESSYIPEMYKQKILEICKGLPLNIVLLGGLLSMKDLSSWFHVLSSGDDSADSVLSMCYDDLSSHLKVCLLYLVLFPKEFDIPVRRLLRLWLAEGFVKLRSTKHFLEDVAQKHFEDLVNRNMIQISKLRSDNSPRRCRVLGVVHDYLLPKARDTSFFYIHNDLASCKDGVGPFGIRRMVEYVGSKRIPWKRASENGRKELRKTDYPSLLTFLSSFSSGRNPMKNAIDIEQGTSPSPSSSPLEKRSINSFNPSLLRSYLSFNVQRKDMPAREVGSLVGSIVSNGFGLLRVLDLEGVYKPSLPEKMGNLHQLRYLGLRWTFLDSLPHSVGELPYLHTLDIKHTFIDELPDSIWRLKHLRHINLNETRLDMQFRSSLMLLTLWGLYLDEKIPMKNGLYELLHLRELGITFHLSSGQDDLMDWITKLSALQSLRLRSVDENGRPSKLVLKPMSTLGRLSHMNLLGNLEKLPEAIEFPPTLKVLTLSISLVKEDPMHTLGLLPCLTVLRLLGQSYTGKEMVCKTGGFSNLRVLKFWMLKELESWQVEEGAMQILKHLNIRSCRKLKSIPTRLLQRKSLEELVLTDMPEELTAQVETHKSVDTSLAVKHWKFPPLPWEEDGSTITKKP